VLRTRGSLVHVRQTRAGGVRHLSVDSNRRASQSLGPLIDAVVLLCRVCTRVSALHLRSRYIVWCWGFGMTQASACDVRVSPRLVAAGSLAGERVRAHGHPIEGQKRRHDIEARPTPACRDFSPPACFSTAISRASCLIGLVRSVSVDARHLTRRLFAFTSP
jgi:hypothetical protein